MNNENVSLEDNVDRFNLVETKKIPRDIQHAEFIRISRVSIDKIRILKN